MVYHHGVVRSSDPLDDPLDVHQSVRLGRVGYARGGLHDQ